MMNIFLNGEERSIPADVDTILKLFDFLKRSPHLKIIELNKNLYKEEEFSSLKLKDGDIIEIVQFIGGGDRK